MSNKSTPVLNANVDILYEATIAGETATQKTVDDNPGQWYPCGSAWVTIRPARGAFVSYLKKAGVGRTSSMGGFVIYNPSQHQTQWMDAKLAGARAFAEVLRKYGINATAESRID